MKGNTNTTDLRVAEIESTKTATITIPNAWCYNTSNNKIQFFKNGKTVMMRIPTIKIAVAGTITTIGSLPSDFCPPDDSIFQLWNTNDRNTSNINVLQIFVKPSGTVQFYGSGAVNTLINAGNTYVYMANN